MPDQVINNCSALEIDGLLLFDILVDYNCPPEKVYREKPVGKPAQFCLRGSVGERCQPIPDDSPCALPQCTLDCQSSKNTACIKGHVAAFEITPESEVILVSYKLPLADVPELHAKIYGDQVPKQVQTLNFKLTGHFWLAMRESWNVQTEVFIPVKDGKVILDRAEWIVSLTD